MNQRWRWLVVGVLMVVGVVGGFVWAAVLKEAFVDELGRVVPATTQARPMWIPAAVCINATPGSVLDLPATNPAVPACVTGLTNVQLATLDFADGANLSVQFHYLLPTAWTGHIEVRLLWFSAVTGPVVWQVQASCVAMGGSLDPTWDTDILALTSTQGTANVVNDIWGELLTTSHLSTCAAEEWLHLKIFRDSAHVSDTLAGTARLLGIELLIRMTFA